MTVTPNSVPRRRPATLATDPFVAMAAEPARGGPADRWQSVRPAVLDRTPVLSGSLPAGGAEETRTPQRARPILAVGAQIATAASLGGGSGAGASTMAFAAPRYGTIPERLSSIGIQIHRETDWTLAALRQVASRAAERAMGEQGIGRSILEPRREDRVAATAERPAGDRPAGGGGSNSGGSGATGGGPPGSGPPPGGVPPGGSGPPGEPPAGGGPPPGGEGPPGGKPPAGGKLPSGGGTIAGGALISPTTGPGLTGPPAAHPEDPNDPCAGQRRWADERCTLAYRAREQAEAAHSAVGTAQRSYDEHQAAAEKAAIVADPGSMRAAKETAQQAFRRARATASGKDGVEAAARDWLTEINRINRAAREAAATVLREREAANALTKTIEHLTLESDAARRAAESAEAACRAARDAVAECQEAAANAQDAAKVAAAARSTGVRPAAASGAAAKAPPAQPALTGRAAARPGAAPARAFAAAAPPAPKKPERPEKPGELVAAFGRTGEAAPPILRLVRGDRSALNGLVAQVAGDNAEARKRWQLAITDLVDAILGRSIEAAALTFPLEHPFWGGFNRAQNRDITAALLSLGFRFDGLGGWTDDRVPTQRDLSLAVGYAGLDPMRVRPWPTEAEIEDLFKEVAVAADEYLAEAAGGLTLGELVSMLGRRADALTEVWNEWPRLRPLLLGSS